MFSKFGNLAYTHGSYTVKQMNVVNLTSRILAFICQLSLQQAHQGELDLQICFELDNINTSG